jgi:hypothetical protein
MTDVERPPETFDEHTLHALSTLLEVHADGIPVAWPPGFDAKSAKAKLERAGRGWTENPSKDEHNVRNGGMHTTVGRHAWGPEPNCNRLRQMAQPATGSYMCGNASSSSDVWSNTGTGKTRDTVQIDVLKVVAQVDHGAPDVASASVSFPHDSTAKTRVGERQRQAENKKRKVEATADAEQLRLADERMALEMGIEIQRAMNARPSRVGERQRQAESRKRRLEAAEAEEAAKRQRTILAASEASTPAQNIMARIRAKVTERVSAHTRQAG